MYNSRTNGDNNETRSKESTADTAGMVLLVQLCTSSRYTAVETAAFIVFAVRKTWVQGGLKRVLTAYGQHHGPATISFSGRGPQRKSDTARATRRAIPSDLSLTLSTSISRRPVSSLSRPPLPPPQSPPSIPPAPAPALMLLLPLRMPPMPPPWQSNPLTASSTAACTESACCISQGALGVGVSTSPAPLPPPPSPPPPQKDGEEEGGQ